VAQKPPATRPDNLSNDIKKLWDHLELCWNIDPQKRPSAADAVNFLEENGRRIAQSLSDDLNMSHLREEPVPSLTGRVTDISIRPVSEGYSYVWTGTLDGSQKVGSNF